MKNWPNDPRLKCTTKTKLFKKFLNFEDSVVFENEDLIVDFNLFEED
jgi:hypothetical protein